MTNEKKRENRSQKPTQINPACPAMRQAWDASLLASRLLRYNPSRLSRMAFRSCFSAPWRLGGDKILSEGCCRGQPAPIRSVFDRSAFFPHNGSMASTFGQLFRITTWGESHGGGVGVVVDGCPPRLKLTEADIQPDLDRRRPGQSKIVSPRREADR